MQSDGLWLSTSVKDWHLSEDYMKMKGKVERMTVVNDLAERAVKDIQDCVGLCHDKERRDEVITVARAQRRKFGKCRKLDMNIACE